MFQPSIKWICVPSLLLVFAGIAQAQPKMTFDQSHAEWDQLVHEYVQVKGTHSLVKYQELKEKGLDLLNSYLNKVSAVTEYEYSKFTEVQKLAFLINADNAFTVKMIISHDSKENPLSSIRDIGSILRNTWKIPFFRFLEEEDSNLDRIESDLARNEFHEPRIHFTFATASLGGPALRNEAYIGTKLEAQLQDATRNFLNDPSRNYYNPKESTLYLASIFNWYSSDFDKNAKFGPLRRFVADNLNIDEKVRERIRNDKVKIKFVEHDWRLNSVN